MRRPYTGPVAARVRLTSVSGSFAARVVAARLVDEGFDVQLRGAVDGPYGLTVGDLARVDLYVPADQLAAASYVLLAGEVESALDPLPAPAPRPARVRAAAVALVLLAVVATAASAAWAAWNGPSGPEQPLELRVPDAAERPPRP